MSKEEREQRDLDQCPKRRRPSDYEGGEGSSKEDIAFRSDPSKSLRPGDPGWVPRARVPMPSTKDYVVRPKWKVDTEISRVSLSMLQAEQINIFHFTCRHLGNKWTDLKSIWKTSQIRNGIKKLAELWTYQLRAEKWLCDYVSQMKAGFLLWTSVLLRSEIVL